MLKPEPGFCQQYVPEHGQVLVSESKNGGGSLPFVWMVDVVPQSAWVLYRINKDEGDETLPVLAFQRHVANAIFLKYSKEGRLSSNHSGIRNVPSDVCYDDTKHYQVQSEHRRILNPFKYLKGSVFA